MDSAGDKTLKNGPMDLKDIGNESMSELSLKLNEAFWLNYSDSYPIEDLVPEVIASGTDDDVEMVFRLAIRRGDFKNYRLLLHELQKRAKQYDEDAHRERMIAAADDPFFSEIQDVHFSESQFHAYCVYLSLAFGFLAAIKRKDNDKIVSDMSHILFAADFGHYHDSVTGDSAGSTRASMLSLICYNACVRGHFEVTMRLLEEPLEIGFVDLEKMLMVVTDKKKQIPGVEALVDMILKKMMELNQLPLIKRIDDSGAVVRPEENGPQDMRFMLAAAMEKAIISCIDQKHHSITPLLLKRYLQMVAEYPAADRQITSAFFEDIAPESYMALSREQCVDLLTLDIPTVVTRGLLRRLCLDPDKEPMDMLLTAQGQTFKAHRDVLSHWSSYFRGLTGHDWVDRNHVKFENNISASALRAVITFVYAGEYQHRGHGDQQAKLEDLLYTADYFGILPLQEQVSGLLDEIEEEEDG